MKASLVRRQKGAAALVFAAIFVIFFALLHERCHKAQASQQG